MADSSKTEKATPKKRRDERKKGHIFFSNDAVSVVVLLACFWTIKILGPMAAEELASFFQRCFTMARSADALPGQELTVQALVTFAKTAGPLLAVSVAAGLGATFFQTKFLVAGESIRPQFSRINPIQGFQRLFSLRSIIEALKGLLKILLLLVLIYQFISGVVTVFTKYFDTDLKAACAHLFDETFQMVNQILLVYVVLAGADVFYQWWEFERQMRMSKQEIKEEYKQMEGDPKIKGKIKETQRRMAQSRMMQQVPQADVVIRNPTHFAVALRYKEETDMAPIVLAKGQDELALRIVRVAEEHKVAVVENVPLARALYASTELNMPIPPELYNAVAEVLVYLYRMNGQLKSGKKVGN